MPVQPSDQRPAEQGHSDQRPPPSPPWHRFSLGGFLIFVLGISAGLAVYRSEGTAWPGILLTIFSVWFLVGMCQTSLRNLNWFRSSAGGLSPELRAGTILSIAGPLLCAGLVALSFGLTALRRFDWIPAHDETFMSMGFSRAVEALFYLGVIGGYALTLQPPTSAAPVSHRGWHMLWSTIAIVIASVWLTIAISNEVATASFVHIAIRSIENAQAHVRHGHIIYAPQYTRAVDELFAIGGLVAGGLAALMCLTLWGLSWRWQGKGSWWWMGAWAALSATTAMLLGWGYCYALPRISPVLITYLFQWTLGYAALFAVLTATVVIMFAIRGSSQRQQAPEGTINGPPTRPPLHALISVHAVFIVGAGWATVREATFWWPTFDLSQQPQWLQKSWTIIELQVSDFTALLRLAAVLLVAGVLIRSIRRSPLELPVWAVEPRKLALLLVLWLISLPLAAAAFMWFGFVTIFWL